MLGDFRLISAITPNPPLVKAWRKPNGFGMLLIFRCKSLSGRATFALATSSLLSRRICCNKVISRCWNSAGEHGWTPRLSCDGKLLAHASHVNISTSQLDVGGGVPYGCLAAWRLAAKLP